ncbi:polyprotein [Graminella nigrifrons virus 1]|uniref:polyprotein n=1 Tax=Graminella nigrifrons virus 1 TaxID=1629132 RepID=UPI0005D94C44|nr:polyprotein [Graminella nigrifrons virus 1]AJT58559.1 polyprotein [Graminella nigrifrons virus 1]
MEKRTRVYKRAIHQKNQVEWFVGGGRERAYRKVHPFGEMSHTWLTLPVSDITGMGIGDGCENWDVDDIPETDVVSPKRVTKTRRTEPEFFGPYHRPRPEAPLRSIMLLTKLRAYIRVLRHSTLVEYNRTAHVVVQKEHEKPLVEWQIAHPQMEGANGEELGTIRSNNVLLAEANPDGNAIASRPQFRFDWHQLCTTEKKSEFDDLTDRFTLFKDYEWNSTYEKGTELPGVRCDLPCDFVNSRTDGSMPILVPFKIYQYFKSDIHIKFRINSNKFQAGQLQFSWQYMEKYDGNPLDNMYSRSQLPHVLLNAGASNEAELIIPFKYVQPFMSTQQRKDDLKSLYLGTLRCFVVSPLRAGATGPKKCSIASFIKFPNAAFTGMRDGSIAMPQMMEAAAAMVAVKAVDKLIGDTNCDNPSDNVNPSYLVPTASHSWCAGTGISEKLQTLRLDNTCVGVGRTGIDVSETSIGIPCRTFGMLEHFEWQTTNVEKNKYGSLLYSCDVHAQVPKNKVNKSIAFVGLDTYAYPPVSVVASLYKQWRGSLEFKFDIISTMFHTGRLLVAYIPNFYGDDNSVTIEQARNSACAEFTLQDATSFTFVVPYISNSVWWSRKYTGPHKYGENAAPSKLFVFVLNPLIPMESVVDSVTIVPYIRAGEDFEVSVPVQPSVGLSDNNLSSLLVKDKVYPTEGSFPFRATKYAGFGNDAKYIFYEGTALLGTASTFYAPYKTLADNEYYYSKAEHPELCGVMRYTSRVDNKEKRGFIQFIVLWNTDKGNYGVPFPQGEEGERQAELVARMLKQGKPADEVLKECFDYIADDAVSSSELKNLFFIPIYKTFDKFLVEMNYAICEMDNRYSTENSLSPTSSLPSTSSGRFNFNEQFNDLKDLARRYQLYGEKLIKIPKNEEVNGVIASFPVVPHGLDLDINDVNSVFNVSRDGHIPVISSGYIYFRGSIRMRLVLASDGVTLGGVKIWVPHHPDGDCRTHALEVYPGIKSQDAFRSHGYSFYMQAMNVNSIVEFEVPFYQSGMYGLTRKMSSHAKNSKVCQYYSLGNIVIGASAGKTDKAVDFRLQVYYSIGDDFSFNVFRGFPRTVFTDEVWPSEKVKKNIVWITAKPEMEPAIIEAEPEMMKAIAGYFTREAISGVKTAIKEEVKDIKDGFKATFQEAKDANVLNFDKRMLITALGNFLHVASNPTPQTLSISIVNVLMSLMNPDSIADVLFLTSALGITIIKNQKKFGMLTKRVEWNEATPQGESHGPDSQTAFCGLLFTAVASIMGVTVSGPSKFPDIMRNINGTVSLANNVIRLLGNCTDLLTYCVNWITAKMNPQRALEIKLMDSVPDIRKWYDECMFLLDIRNRDRYLYDANIMNRVFDASMFGNLIIANGMNKSLPGGKVIIDTCKEIRKLQGDLYQRNVHPDVRFEVFPIWMSGSPGIGKTYLVKDLSKRLLAAAQVQHKGTTIYDIPSGAKYWSGCTNPLVLVSDDLFQVAGQRMEEELANIFLICSSSVLNPPMAAVEDKERRLNPLLYIMFCNSHFPEITPTSRTPEAVYRRRKFLIKAELKDELVLKYPNFQDAGQLEPEEIRDFKHLKFQIALEPKNPNTAYSDWMTYDQLLGLITPKFLNHLERERLNFRQRMIDLYCFDPDFDEEDIIMNMPNLDDKPLSLADQMDIMRETVQARIENFNDPQREPEVWDYIRRLKEKWTEWRNKRAQPQMGLGSAITSMLRLQEEVDKVHEIVQEISNTGPLYKLFPELSFVQASVINELKCSHSFFFSNNTHHLRHLKEQLFDPNFLDEHCFGRLGSSPNFIYDCRQALVAMLSPSKDVTNVGAGWRFEVAQDINNVAQFNEKDYLRFFLMHKHGAQIIYKLMYKDGFDSLNDDFANSLDILFTMLGKDTSDDKLSLKYIVRNLTAIDTPRRMRTYHIKSLLDGVVKGHLARFSVSEKRRADFKIVRNGSIHDVALKDFDSLVDKIAEASCITTAVRTFFDIFLSLVYVFDEKSERPFMDIVEFKRLVACMMIIYECIPNCIYSCNLDVPTRKFIRYCEKAEFCTFSGRVELDGEEFKRCDKCVYSSPILEVLLAYCAVGCRRRSRITGHFYGQEIIEITPYANVRQWLRKKNRMYADTFFDRLAATCKHIFFHLIPDFFKHIVAILKFRLPAILVTLGGLLAPSAIGGALNWASGGSLPPIGPSLATGVMTVNHVDGVPQGNYFKFDHPKHPAQKSVQVGQKSFVSPQMGQSGRQAIGNKISNNTVFIYVSGIQDGTRMTGNCPALMLKGRSMLVLKHYFEEYEYLVKLGYSLQCTLFYQPKGAAQPAKIPIPYADLVNKIAWCSASYERLTSNYGIVFLPNYVPQFKDITKTFAFYKEHDNVGSTCDLYCINKENSFDIPVRVQRNVTVTSTSCSSAVFLDKVYSYGRQRAGLCGSVLVCDSLGSGNGAIVGMHVAGNEKVGFGYSEPLYRELFDQFFNAFPEVVPLDDTPLLNLEEANVDLSSNLIMYGCVPEKFAHKESGKTKIIPSLIAGQIYPVRTEVNPLAPNDKRQPPGSHPLRDGCNKHGTGDIRPFDPSLVEKVKEELSDTLYQVVKPVRAEVKPLTLQQAICGDVDVEYFESLSWKSSEGFPLSALRPREAHDKRWLFELAEGKFGYELKGLHPLLKQQLAARDKCFKENSKPPTIYVDCLKDYRLPPEKCKIPGKTRIFSTAPVQCSIDIRMYMNDFCAGIKKSHIENSIGIGINVDSMEWTKLVLYLFEVGTKIVTLDYSNFGPCLMSQLVGASADIIVNWFKRNNASEEHVNRVRWLLECDIINPVHLRNNVVYQTVNGIASGSPLTGECNSIPNLMYIRLAYLEIMMASELSEFASMYYFNLFVRLVVYGDDLIMSVSDDIAAVFNALSIRDCLAKHGITVTSAQKDAEMTPYTTIYEATFLKRSFKHHPFRAGVWLGPVETKSVEECLNWCHVSENLQEATLEVCRASMDLAYSHGPEYYNQHKNKIIDALRNYDVRMDFLSWHERDNQIFGDSSSIQEPTKIECKFPWVYKLGHMTL